jgi:hypothetical protein
MNGELEHCSNYALPSVQWNAHASNGAAKPQVGGENETNRTDASEHHQPNRTAAVMQK